MIRLKGNIPEQLSLIFSDYIFNYRYKDEIKERLIFCFEQVSKQKFEELSHREYMNWFFSNCIIENNEMVLINSCFFKQNKDSVLFNMTPIWYKEKKDMVDEEIRVIITISILLNLYEETTVEEVLYLNINVMKNLDVELKDYINNNIFNLEKLSLFVNPFSNKDIYLKIKNLKNKLTKVKVNKNYFELAKKYILGLMKIDTIFVTSDIEKEMIETRIEKRDEYECKTTSSYFRTFHDEKLTLFVKVDLNNKVIIESIYVHILKEKFKVDENLNFEVNNLKFSNQQKEKIKKEVNYYLTFISKLKNKKLNK